MIYIYKYVYIYKYIYIYVYAYVYMRGWEQQPYKAPIRRKELQLFKDKQYTTYNILYIDVSNYNNNKV